MMHTDDPLLTEQEAARYLKISVGWLRKQRYSHHAGTLQPIKLGRAVRYRREDLVRLIAELA